MSSILWLSLECGLLANSIRSWAALAVIAAILMAVVFFVRKAPLVGAVLVALFVFLFISLFWVRRESSVSSASRIHLTSVDGDLSKVAALREANMPPIAWKPEVDETFFPDLYPSKEKARQDLGRRVQPLLLEALSRQHGGQTDFDATNQIVIHTSDKHPVDDTTLHELQISLVQSFPNTPVTVSSTTQPGKPIEDSKHFHLEATFEPDRRNAGEFQLAVHRRDGSALETKVRFVDAPWVFEEGDGDPNFVRVRTADFESSRNQAESAVKDAAADVMAQVFRQLPFARNLPPDFDERAVIRRTLSRAEDELFEDKFTQKLILPIGDKVYRSAARISMGKLKPKLARLASEPHSWDPPPDQKRSSLRGLAGLMLAVVGVFYGLKVISQKITESQASGA